MNRTSASLIARLRERAAMCLEFSHGAEGTRLARELSSLAAEMVADARRIAETEARREQRP